MYIVILYMATDRASIHIVIGLRWDWLHSVSIIMTIWVKICTYTSTIVDLSIHTLVWIAAAVKTRQQSVEKVGRGNIMCATVPLLRNFSHTFGLNDLQTIGKEGVLLLQ